MTNRALSAAQDSGKVLVSRRCGQGWGSPGLGIRHLLSFTFTPNPSQDTEDAGRTRPHWVVQSTGNQPASPRALVIKSTQPAGLRGPGSQMDAMVSRTLILLLAAALAAI